jgi:HEAT repeat protein
MMNRFRPTAVRVFAVLWLAAIPAAATGETLEEFLDRIRSKDDGVRLQARAAAPRQGAQAIAPLAALMGHDDLNVRYAARAAMENIVHHAGRPGGVEERADACAALVKLLGADQSANVRRESVHLLGYIAGDRSAPAVAALLADPDPHVRETARLSLEIIPGEAATDALLAAIEKAEDAQKGDFLYSLSKRNAARAVPVALALAGSGADAVRLAALEALARMTAPESIEAFEKAIEKSKDAALEKVLGEYLRLADRLAASVDKAKAPPIYRRVLAAAKSEHLREQALHGACPAGARENLELLVASLGDSSRRVRRLASSRLSSLEGADVLAAIEKAYRGGAREARPALLRALAERQRDAAGPLLEEAAASADAALKVTALDISGKLDQPELESIYLDLAQKGPEAVRGVAVRGLLLLADRKLKDKRPKEALAMLQTVLALDAADAAQRSQAIAGLSATAEPAGLDALAKLLGDSTLANDAARGLIRLAIAVGEAGAPDPAVEHLQRVLTGQFPQEIVSDAVEALKRLGKDPQAALKAQGFVVEWWLTTPIQDRDGRGFETKFFPEELLEQGAEMGFDKVHEIGPRRVRWRLLDRLSDNGVINLDSLFRRSENVLVYAYVELESRAEEDVLFKMGSDDGVACWLNNRRIHAAPTPRGLKVDEDAVPAKLQKGKNRVLLKITQKSSGWGFVFRVTDPAGKALDTAALVKPPTRT